MSEFLLLGACIGAVVGLLHATHIFRERMRRGRGDPLSAAWFASWALGLWTLLGAYVLAFWLIGLVAMALSRLLPRRAGE